MDKRDSRLGLGERGIGYPKYIKSFSRLAIIKSYSSSLIAFLYNDFGRLGSNL